jgi:anhydro-N-acetylmuramic acid kinase
MPWTWQAHDPAIVIGLISGTSADGVDAALCRLAWEQDGSDVPRGAGVDPKASWMRGDPASAEARHAAGGRAGAGRLRLELLATATDPYPEELRTRVLGAARLSTPDIAALDVELGERFAQAAAALCRESGLPLARVDLIGSHGQTVWHDPRALHGRVRATLQLGEPAVIAARTGRDVVADFRPADVALGGEGAPLVPLVDFLLLDRPGVRRAVLNLGGIANVTWLAGSGRPEDVVAFDTGPGNMLSDGLVRRFGLAAEGYDAEGRLARGGAVHEGLLGELLADPFFSIAPPRSTGRERFGEPLVERVARRGGELGLAPADLLATAARLTATSGVEAILRHCGRPDEVLLCGGGRRNEAMRAELLRLLPDVRLADTDDEGLDGDAKEAIAFAVLAYLAARGLPNHLPHTTGASRVAVLGKLVPGAPGSGTADP